MYALQQGNSGAIQALRNPIPEGQFNLIGFVGRSHSLPTDYGSLQALPATTDPDLSAFQSVETSIGTRPIKAFDATEGLFGCGSLAAAVFDPPTLPTFRSPCTLCSKNKCQFMDNKFVRPIALETAALPQSQFHPFGGEMAISLHSSLVHDSPSLLSPLQAVKGAEKPQSAVKSIAPLPCTEDGTRVTRVREKKHPCWMCTKSFDRPSTLRKVRLIIQSLDSTRTQVIL
jgi:hypothetical protein